MREWKFNRGEWVLLIDHEFKGNVFGSFEEDGRPKYTAYKNGLLLGTKYGLELAKQLLEESVGETI